MSISKKERDEAILWLEMAADAWIREREEMLDFEPVKPSLARSAELAVESLFSNNAEIRRIRLDGCPWLSPVDYLEAAALLREGWCPGNPVELVKKG